ncbi:MAG: CehA/McbA family metallohydrolase [Acidobacteria bacterium]|nr:CehA/McbA family metallohydrolase [Acidobacteriota bacterium]
MILRGKELGKKILRILLTILLLYCVWLGLGILRFRVYVAEPGEEGPRAEITGVYHIHTTLSDGKKSPDEVAAVAAAAGLDFIILTDHGRPNRESMAARGWKEGLLVLAGSELSVNRGHMTGLGFDMPDGSLSRIAEEAAAHISRNGGFTIVAHPYSDISWTWGDKFLYSGVEVMDAYSMLRGDFLRSLPALPALLVRPGYFLLKSLDRPDRLLQKWDSLTADQPVFGYFSTDAHFAYRVLFRLLRLHVQLDGPLPSEFEAAEKAVFDALREGRFYNAVDGAARPHGFLFDAKSGKTIFPMGRTIPFGPALTLRVQTPFPFRTSIRLLRNGRIVADGEGNALLHTVTEPGVYRAEVFLKERTPMRHDVPWIVSNPIFVRK